jgi:hypothetical protein
MRKPKINNLSKSLIVYLKSLDIKFRHFICNNCVEVEGEVSRTGMILIKIPNKSRFFSNSDYRATIIHEFGHVISGHFLAEPPGEALLKQEKDAWENGKNAVPNKFIPKSYDKIRDRSLGTYIRLVEKFKQKNP